MYGATAPPQNEATPFYPRSPYAVSKLAAHWYTVNYREAYGMFAVNGILFNHESPRRGETFVTRKITRAATRIKLGLQQDLYLGNLDAKRDWGWSPEFVDAIYRIMQHEKPDVFVVATGETHTIEDFVKAAFAYVDLDWEKYVQIDAKYKRPNEVPLLLGDASKMRTVIGWQPKMKFKDIVKEMIDHDLNEYD